MNRLLPNRSENDTNEQSLDETGIPDHMNAEVVHETHPIACNEESSSASDLERFEVDYDPSAASFDAKEEIEFRFAQQKASRRPKNRNKSGFRDCAHGGEHKVMLGTRRRASVLKKHSKSILRPRVVPPTADSKSVDKHGDIEVASTSQNDSNHFNEIDCGPVLRDTLEASNRRQATV
ncbi:unnamed protein product [Agarophyton chilense]